MFITFKDEESVQMLLGLKLSFRGKMLVMRKVKDQKPTDSSEHYVKGVTKVFVGAVPSKTTFEEFQQYFEKYGPIDDIFLPMKSKSKGVNRGHGFVNFVYPLSAKIVMEQYKDHQLKGKWVS